MEESEGAEAYTCYICLEECEEKSPCQCAAHVHMECLNKSVEINTNYKCTICQKEFTMDFNEYNNESTTLTHCIMTAYTFMFLLLLYILTGWFGKCFLMLIDRNYYTMRIATILSFWNIEHLVCSLAVCSIILVVIRVVEFLNR
jgi:hypothetical protein